MQNHVDQARGQLAQANRAFAQNPTPSLSRSIQQLQRYIRRHCVTRYHVEFTDTFGGEANYCFVHRFAVQTCSIRGAAIVAARHLGYSGRVHCVGNWGDGARYDIRGAALCFFVQWGEVSDDYPLINGKGV